MEKTIDEAIGLVMQGKLDFPGFLKIISGVGVERYNVDVASHKVVYHAGPKDLTKHFSLPPLVVASLFDEGGIKDAIASSQKKEITYQQFLERIAKAGVAGYETDISGRKVTYSGNGCSYVEPFPSK